MFVLIFFILLLANVILPIIVSAKLAARKNRSVPGWIFATVFFGWVAVVVLAILEKHSEK